MLPVAHISQRDCFCDPSLEVEMPINAAIAYNTLVANPGQFLKQYPVRIYGDMGASGIANYTLLNLGQSRRPGSRLGTLRMHATESFEVRSNGAMLPGMAGHPFTAHSIHMDLGAAAMGFYRLDGAGPNIMVTGQLSGCSFAMLSAGPGQVDVAHVKPVAMTGQTLYANITGAIPNAHVYGAAATGGHYDSLDRVVSIIGVRSGGQWSIYVQKQDPGPNIDYSIKSVYRIYPNKQKL